MDPLRAQLFVVNSNTLAQALPTSQLGDWNMHTGRGNQKILFGIQATQAPTLTITTSSVMLPSHAMLHAPHLTSSNIVSSNMVCTNLMAGTGSSFSFAASNLICTQASVQKLQSSNAAVSSVLSASNAVIQNLTCTSLLSVPLLFCSDTASACNLAVGSTISTAGLTATGIATLKTLNANNVAFNTQICSNASTTNAVIGTLSNKTLVSSNISVQSMNVLGSITKNGVEIVSALGLVGSQWSNRDNNVFVGLGSNIGVGTDTPVSEVEVLGTVTCTSLSCITSCNQQMKTIHLSAQASTSCNATIGSMVCSTAKIGTLSNAFITCSNLQVRTTLSTSNITALGVTAAYASFSNTLLKSVNFTGPIQKNGQDFPISENWIDGSDGSFLFCRPGVKVGLGGNTAPMTDLDVQGTTRTTRLQAESATFSDAVSCRSLALQEPGQISVNGRSYLPFTYTPDQNQLVTSTLFGLNTLVPKAQLDVNGSAIISSNLQVGQTVLEQFQAQAPRLILERSSNVIAFSPTDEPGNTFICWNGIYHPVLGMLHLTSNNDAAAWGMYTESNNLFGFTSRTQTGGVKTPLTMTKDGFIGLGMKTPTVHLDLATDDARKLSTSTWLTGSDARVKENIQAADLNQCLDTVRRLELKRFSWKKDAYPNVRDRNVLGWVAQEVELLFPNAVLTAPAKHLGLDDFKSLDSDQLYKCLFGAVQHLANKVEALENKITASGPRT